MKKLRVIAGALVSSLALSMAAGSAMAADGDAPTGVVNGGEVQIVKNLDLGDSSVAPEKTFTFSILGSDKTFDGDDDLPLDVRTGKALPGDVQISFEHSDQPNPGETTVSNNTSYDIDAQMTEAEKNTIQRYEVSENAGQDTDVFTYDDTKYILDVYVGDDGNVSYMVGRKLNGDQLGDKAPIVFNNQYLNHSLKLSKKVVNNTPFGASDVFNFDLTVNADQTGLLPNGTTLRAYVTDANGPVINPNTHQQEKAEITVGQKADIALKDGQTLELKGLPKGVTYTVSEEANADFTTTYSIDNGQAQQGLTANGSINTTDSTVAFTNTRTEITPTGVVMAVAPYVVALAVVAGAGAWFVARRVKKQA